MNPANIARGKCVRDEILRLIAEGITTQAGIAEKLGIKIRTISHHIGILIDLRKITVSSLPQDRRQSIYRLLESE